jgi:hypothetical protein
MEVDKFIHTTLDRDYYKYLLRNFTMVGKNIDHPSGEIERWKNKRYRSESTNKYQKDEDSTEIGGTSSKIDLIKSVFFVGTGP